MCPEHRALVKALRKLITNANEERVGAFFTKAVMAESIEEAIASSRKSTKKRRKKS